MSTVMRKKGNTFEPGLPFIIQVSSEEDYNSIDELVRELDREKTTVVISKDIRKFSKPVTVISGLQNRNDARDITKRLKSKIGTGGTFKDGQIILQGDHRETAKNLLVEMGFNVDSIQVF